MVEPELTVEIDEFPSDGSLILTCKKGDIEHDLVFAFGAMAGDPELKIQRGILQDIADRVNNGK